MTILRIAIATDYQEEYHAPCDTEPKDLILRRAVPLPPAPVPFTTHPTFATVNAGLLSLGDEFEFQPNDIEGAGWKVYTFRGHVITERGAEHINCYGGDPIRSNSEHDRAWRAFDPERVRAGARPVRANWRTKRV